MTSRTNRHAVGRNQGGAGDVAPADLESRRHLAVKRYLDGDPIERICQEMGCAKSWLYTLTGCEFYAPQNARRLINV